MSFEQHNRRLAPWSVFLRRVIVSILMSGSLIAMTLLIGVCGYHYIAGFGWVDALLNASMILGGMGPVGDLPTPMAKIFASLYALFCGLIFVAAMGILISPLLHRMLHWFHIDEQDLR